MDEQPQGYRDPMSRVAVRQVLWLGVAATGAFVALMVALAWASSVTGGDAVVGRAIDVDSKTITLALADEPPQLDSTRVTDTISIFVLGHIMEGLLRYDASNRLVPGGRRALGYPAGWSDVLAT